jgi:MFS family permease
MCDAVDLNLLALVLAPIGGLIVGIKLVTWGVGGVASGVLTDRIGRTRRLSIGR